MRNLPQRARWRGIRYTKQPHRTFPAAIMATTSTPSPAAGPPPVTIDLIRDALRRSAEGVRQTPPTPPPGRRRPIPGDVIAGYRLVRHLGRGGMAEVFEALHLHLRRRVALKLLVVDEEHRALAPRFLREARAMMQVRHLNLIAIHDAGQVDDLHYLAMELMDGGDLGMRILRDGAVPLGQALRWTLECANGLAALHQAGLVHRDIKPGNIFLSDDGEVKIGDFGLARQSSGADRMTVTGTAWGTPSYMAPEQIVGARDVDARADIYALGATLYTMLTAREPFSGETAYLATFKAMTQPFPDPREHDPTIPAAVAGIVRMATEHARERRYPSMRTLCEDLERVLRHERPLHVGMVAAHPATVPCAYVPPVPPSRPIAPPARTRPVVMVLVAAALGGLAWWWAAAPAVVDPGLPAWATAGGRDAFGRWAEITIGEATTRLRYRPPTTFVMGSPPGEHGRSASEVEHAVTLSGGVWIQDTECDQAFFQAVMGHNPSRHRGAQLPVENLNQAEALEFCRTLALRGVPARLPSEAEWEEACRAGNREAYADEEPGWTASDGLATAWMGGEGAARAWCEERHDDLRLRARPVAARRPNAAGLFDLHGNVLEWCADRWDGQRPYPSTPEHDPLALTGPLAVARGGSWFHLPERARSAARTGLEPTRREAWLGFRFVIPHGMH
jgi:serine/threonine protein kinase/formylglycine-generating enzyme required for sulfatase activity